MIKGIIFDLGGVLMHLGCRWREVDQVATAALIDFLTANGISVGENFAAVFNAARQQGWQLAEQTEIEQGMEAALRIALGPAADGRVRRLLPQAVETYFRVREQYWVSNPDALQVLRTLSARGLCLGAISNAEHDNLMQWSVARLGFSSYLHPVVTSARVKWRKPNPRIFQYIAEEWSVDSTQIVMVGNVPWEDIAGAHRAGMRAVLIEHRDTRQSYPMRHRSDDPVAAPDATVETLAEIPAVIAQM